MNEKVARGNVETKMGTIIRTTGPNGEKEYEYNSESSMKHAFLFRTQSELESIREALNVAEQTYRSKLSNPDLAYFLWTGAIVRLCSLFDGYYLKYTRNILDNANVEFAWKCLKEHRNSDLTHNTNKQDYPKFAFFFKSNESLPFKDRLQLSPKYSRNSYPPFTDAFNIVTSMLQRLTYCCKEEIVELSKSLKKEMVELGIENLEKQPEFEIMIRKNSWSKAMTKYKEENPSSDSTI